MKIAVFTQQLEERSGWGRYSLELIEALRTREHDVVVFCEKPNPAVGVAQYALLPSPIAFKRILLSRLFRSSVCKRLLDSKGFMPDIVHCFVEPYAPLAALLSKQTGAPLIITVHGSYAVRTLTPLFFGWLQRRAYRAARAIVCISSYTQKRLLSLESTVSTMVIPNGVRVPANRSPHHAKEPMLLGVGALKERKGYRYVLEALPEIIRAAPDVTYVVVGNQRDIVYMNSLKGSIQRLKLEKHIIFKKGISDEELDELYRRAKAFVLTPVSSPDSFEGFGLVYLEANAHGVPVVGSCDNGGEDAIVDGRTGYLTKPGDPHDIAEKVVRLLRLSDEEYVTVSAECRTWAKSHSWKIVAERYEELYRMAIA